MLLAHGAALLLVLVLLVWVVPRFDRMFMEFGLSLPVFSVVTINLSRIFVRYALFLIPPLILIDIGPLVLLSVGDQFPGWLRLLWFYGVLFIAGCLVLLIAVGIFLPLMQLQEDLS